MIKCNILNCDTLADKIGIEPKRIWGKFRFEKDQVFAYMQFFDDGEMFDDCVEVCFRNGKNYVIDIPFNEFETLMDSKK